MEGRVRLHSLKNKQLIKKESKLREEYEMEQSWVNEATESSSGNMWSELQARNYQLNLENVSLQQKLQWMQTCTDTNSSVFEHELQVTITEAK